MTIQSILVALRINSLDLPTESWILRTLPVACNLELSSSRDPCNRARYATDPSHPRRFPPYSECVALMSLRQAHVRDPELPGSPRRFRRDRGRTLS